MASVSSLLKSAQATQAKIQSVNDAEVAFEWENSAQTYDDYVQYSNYLNGQLAKTTDPTSQISYQTKLRSALSSYTSNEIQRQGQAVMDGSSTIQDKMTVVSSLYDQAVANGDENLAQNLVTTWDSLSVQAQNEATASAATNTTAFKNQVSDTIDQYKNLQSTFVSAFQQATTPDEQKQNIAKINANLPANLQVDPNAGIFDIVASVANAIAGNGGILQQAISLAPDDASRRTYQEEFDGYASGTTPVATLPGADGKNISLSLQDVQKQIAAAQVGQTIYSPVSGANGTVWNTNTLDNYTFGRDANGNTVAVPTYSQGGMNLSNTVTDTDGNPIYLTGANGKITTNNGQKEQATYQDLLERAGFNVTDSGGSMIVNDPSGKGRLNGENTVQAYIDSNGQLQFADNENNLFAVNFDKNGNFTGTGKEIANPFIAEANSGQRNENSPYFANNPDQANEAANTAGLLTPQTISQFNNEVGINKNPILNSGQISPSNLPQFSPTQVLQGAASIQAANRENSIQAPQLTSSPVPQLQAPSLNPANISNKASITVAKPTAPTATISTKPINNNPTVTVQKKAPSFNISF